MQPLPGQDEVRLDRDGRQESDNCLGIIKAHHLRRALGFNQLEPSCRKSFRCPLEQKAQRCCRRWLPCRKRSENRKGCLSHRPHAFHKRRRRNIRNRIRLSFRGQSGEMKPVSDVPWGVQQIVALVGHVPGEDGVGEVNRRMASYEVSRRPDGIQIIRHGT